LSFKWNHLAKKFFLPIYSAAVEFFLPRDKMFAEGFYETV